MRSFFLVCVMLLHSYVAGFCVKSKLMRTMRVQSSMSTRTSAVGIRQFFEKESSTYTYLLYDKFTLDSILIDPVVETAER